MHWWVRGLSCKPNIYVSWSTSELRVRLAPLNRFKPSSKIFYWPFQGGTSFVDILCCCSVLCLLCLCARLFICALWSPAGKGLTSWLSFVVSNWEFVTFPLVSWVRCSTWLYRFLIFAPLLTLQILCMYVATFHCPNAILDQWRGEEEKHIKLNWKTCFNFKLTNVTYLSIFRTHAQKEDITLFDSNSTSIHSLLIQHVYILIK